MNPISGSASTGYQPVLQDNPAQGTALSVHGTTCDDRLNPYYEAPILAASRTGNLPWLRELLAGDDGQLDHDLALNLVSQSYLSGLSGESVYPLYMAAQMGHLEVVLHLTSVVMKALENQPDDEKLRVILLVLNAARKSGATPLYIAAQNGYPVIVEHIISAVMKAVENQPEDEKIRFILLVLNAALEDGATPLFIAAQYGYPVIVEHIISAVMKAVESQPDDEKIRVILLVLNAALKNGATPLFAAALNDHPEVVKHIFSVVMKAVENQPDNEKLRVILLVLNAPGKDGATPLYIAAQFGYFKVMEHMIRVMNKFPEAEKLRVLNATCKNGDTPLRIASKKGHYHIVNLLLHHGADPEQRKRFSPLGKYPVFKACLTRAPLKYFLTQTPRQAALKGGHEQIAKRIDNAIHARKTVATTSVILPPTSAVNTETAL